ncbi:mini-ribonuclease 3 [Philodulcilactobacillus myokoensis]|uniref:Mini-ribonuclease 3 n=1 Tax=Philodulcilactobacillus myokoensis TaxID=2929573 RepID=A0A9W6ESV2_9LACO|nr:Mini-ribonuclease 3 [Philodulcilactobacillus myokoensis]GLB47180.1 mini-ribonuclease 3 [Philodulcilactobacillus myokoensis]
MIKNTTVDYNQLNGVVLAYLGDSVYEVYIRRHLLTLGITKPNRLQKTATKYVSAKAQAALINLMLHDDVLTKEELSVFKRGRNAKSHTHAKNTNVVTYRISTGFEAIMGYLSLSNQEQRLDDLSEWCIKQIDDGREPYEK